MGFDFALYRSRRVPNRVHANFLIFATLAPFVMEFSIS